MQKFIIDDVDKDEAIEFIQKHHYSKILPRLTKYYLGVYGTLPNGVDGLLGVITLGWGTQPLQTIKKLFPDENLKSEDYLEIGKMCFSPYLNNNSYSGSTIMAALVKWMKKNTNCMFLYTLADGIMGKCGYVYQASNFKYIGKFKTSVYMDVKTKEKIHPRSAKTLLQENAKWENKEKVFWLTHDFCEHKGIDKINGVMFRYMYPLNKTGKNLLKKHYIDNVKFKDRNNPKDCNLVFEKRSEKGKFIKINKPDFNMNVFNYNYQKY